MPPANTIAIDGPAGSGKSTIGQKLAARLGYQFFDTGVMYRALTWLAMAKGLDLADEAAITALAEQAEMDIRPSTAPELRSTDILVDGADVSQAIRSERVEANVSLISAYPGVRRALTQQQRKIGQRGHVVMVGRDIGTVVLPEADFKLYLDASVEERARRRWLERLGRGEAADLQTIAADMRQRDQLDSNRVVAPLRAAPDAILLNTDHLSITEVIERILASLETT